MLAPSPLLLAQADSARAIASVYTVSLLATVPMLLAIVAAVALRRASAEARALVWRSAIAALLVVVIGRQLPLQWIAWVVPAFFATPLVALGRMQVGAASAPGPDGASTIITALFVVYLTGVFAVLIPTIGASIAARRRLRRSTRVTSDAWTSMMNDVRRQLWIDRDIQLFVSPHATVPMTWGLVKPVVVLPPAALEWSDDERRIVLMHELTHVRAADWIFALAARVMCAVLWFHPGVWWIARALREDCELACDDRVIASGVRRSDYAELLVSAADARRMIEPRVALALARRSGLRARLAAVLDAKHDTRPLARGWAVVAMVITFGVAVPTSVVQLAPTRDVLTSLMRDASWQSRAYAVVGLAQRPDSVDVAVSAAELDPSPRVREWARYALARNTTSRDLSELLRNH
jgi:beta-lactamase regulating signal transducer with metallopeptidase domain